MKKTVKNNLANPTSHPTVLIVIVNWNGKDDLLECLASIRKLNYPETNYKVLVVDNGSNDGSQAAISKNYSDVCLLQNKQNIGYVKAVNQGIAYGLNMEMDYIWVFNNDVIVEENSLNKLTETGQQDEDIGIIAPVIYSYDNREKIDNVGYKINFWTGRLKKLKYGRDIFENCKDKIADVDSILGCSNLIKTQVFRKVGSFRPIYELYFEETDFNVRARQKGFRVVVVKEARVWHKNASTMNRYIFRRAYLILRNLFLFELLNAKLKYLLVFIPYYFLAHCPYFLIYGGVYGLTVKLKKTKYSVRFVVLRQCIDKLKQASDILFLRKISFTHDNVGYTLEKVSTRKLFNWIMSEWASKSKRLYPFTMPKYLELEPTNYCNLRCPGCTVGRGDMDRYQGKMGMDDYKNVIDQLKDYLLLVILFERGEPFLHETLCDMIGYASARNIRVFVSTNGHFLNSIEKAESIVRSGLDHLVVSLDGATHETYQKYRRGGDFDRVIEGMRTLIDVRNRLGSITPKINLRFIPMRHNEHEISQVQRIASILGVDILSFKTYNPSLGPEGAVHEFLPQNEKYLRYLYGKEGHPVRNEQNHCTKLWNTISVRWNGSVVPCNCDHQDSHILGSLKNQTLKEVWKGDSFAEFRRNFRDNWHLHPLCGSCTYAYTKPGGFSVKI